MSADQQVELFRELTEADRARLLHVLDAPTRDALKLLFAYPPDDRGRHHDDGVRLRARDAGRCEQALDHISEVGRAKETIYAIYCHRPGDAARSCTSSRCAI